jgi:organic hydroperoxide reductase OsmC/OhrA
MSQYVISASVKPDSLVDLTGAGLPSLVSGPPKEFGGSGAEWSPEDLLVGAVADCFVLAFKADRAMQFTALNIQATLTIPADADADRATRLLEKAEQTCFITNSLKADPELTIEIKTA